MNKSFFYVILLFPTALIAMEQNQPEESQKSTQNELLSLVDACTKCMSKMDLNGDEQERYLNARRTTMEKLLSSGGLGNTDITIKVIESMPQTIIDEYEAQLRAFFATQIDDIQCAIVNRLSDENVNKYFDEIINDASQSSRVKYALIERAARVSSLNTNVRCVDSAKLLKNIEKIAEQGSLTYKVVKIFFDLLKVPSPENPEVKGMHFNSLLSILKGELVSMQARKHGNAALMSDYLQEYFNKHLKILDLPTINIDNPSVERLTTTVNMYFDMACIKVITTVLRELNRIQGDPSYDFIINYPKNCVNFNCIEQWLDCQDLQRCSNIVNELLWIKHGGLHLGFPVSSPIIALVKEIPVEFRADFFEYIQLKLNELNTNQSLPEEYKKIVEGLQKFFTWLCDKI